MFSKSKNERSTFSLTTASAMKDGQLGLQKWAGPGRLGSIRRSVSGISSTAATGTVELLKQVRERKEGRKEGRNEEGKKEGRKEERKKERKEGRKEGRKEERKKRREAETEKQNERGREIEKQGTKQVKLTEH